MHHSTINTAKDLISFLKEKLGTIYEREEAENLSFMVAHLVSGISKTDYVLNSQLPRFHFMELQSIVERLLNHEPIQHILGYTDFLGCRLKVTPDVLIPRPETEEIVHHVVQKCRDKTGKLRIIDYCTGSGCIAIALAKHLLAEVVAIDLSEKALTIAQENAQTNGVHLLLEKVDLLSETNLKWTNVDIIVSNPPYVLENEKANMNKNVLDYDPHLALFVETESPLIFYEKIVALAKNQLKNGGELFVEINEQFGQETKRLLETHGFVDVEIILDFRGKDRLVSGRLMSLS